MRIQYKKLIKKRVSLQRLVGVTGEEFQDIGEGIKPLWREQVEGKKGVKGRPSRLHSVEDRVMALLIDYRRYVTHEFIGYLFNVHNANICRLFKRLEPLMAKKLASRKDWTLTADKVLKLLAEVTEQPIQRPVKVAKQKVFYSGKKKHPTPKVEIVMEATGRIISVFKSYPG